MNILHIVGPPGSGKSTLVDAMTAGLVAAEFDRSPMFWLQYEPGGVVELGRLATEEKPRRGSDRLTMNAIEYVWPWLRALRPTNVLIEGARLEARSFLHGACRLGYDYRAVYLHVPYEERLARLGGRAQNEQWMRGRESGSRRFAEEAGAAVLLGAGASPEGLAEELARLSEVAHRLHIARNVTLPLLEKKEKPPAPPPARTPLGL